MANEGWNPWKMTAIGFGLVAGLAVVTGVVVVNWTSLEPTPRAQAPERSSVPTQVVIDACNQQAAAQSNQASKTTEVVKDGAIPAAGHGVLYGVDESRKTDEQYRVTYASCMRSRGYTD